MKLHKFIRELSDITIVCMSIFTLSISLIDFMTNTRGQDDTVKYLVTIIALIVVRQNADNCISKYEKSRKGKKHETV